MFFPTLNSQVLMSVARNLNIIEILFVKTLLLSKYKVYP